MKITIWGDYITKFGELWDRSLEDLLKEAMEGAILEAKINVKEIEAVYVANMGAGRLDNQLHLGALASSLLPHYPPAMRIEGACASGGLAVIAAEQGLLSSSYQTMMVVGVEKMTDAKTAEATEFLAGAADFKREYGSTFPALYGILTLAHMKKFGTTRKMLSAVSNKNHRQAMNNPEAQFHKEYSIKEISQSQLIADPIRLLDCSPISDGAAAVVLTTKNVKGPKILGFGQGSDSLTLADRKKLTELGATKRAAMGAYKMAGISAVDVEMAEVHDCFSIGEILAIEDLGFFKKGEGGRATLKGMTTYGGKIVINPSGGLKACGHPVGATGVKQVAYMAGLIKKGKINIGLTQNVGGSGGTAVVHILGGGK